jgi:cytochrome P450
MNRITLNVMLRTIFGADAPELGELRDTVPPYIKRGQLLVFVSAPPAWARRFSPWRKLDVFREAFDSIVCTLADRAETDPRLSERTDLLSLLVCSGCENGTRMSRRDICDELLTHIAAGSENTASALAWAFERLRRYPDVLAELVREVDEGGHDFRRATVLEVMRARTVLDVAGRRVSSANFDLGGWRIPRGHTVFVRIADLHENADIYPCPQRFDPNRFRGASPAPACLPFGGGERRCVGADFALAEIDVVLRTVLQNFRIHTDAAAEEKSHFRGVVHTPKLGGRVVLTRRR